jgi:flagellar M-ring protein FliF
MIKDVVAGVTGFNADRGDQLIVETLPFESSLNTEPPPSSSAPKPNSNKDPEWLQMVMKYKYYAAGAIVLILAVVVFLVIRMRRRAVLIEAPEVLNTTEPVAQVQAGSTALTAAGRFAAQVLAASEGDGAELADRIRELAKREPAVTANALRMWLAQNGN